MNIVDTVSMVLTLGLSCACLALTACSASHDPGSERGVQDAGSDRVPDGSVIMPDAAFEPRDGGPADAITEDGGEPSCLPIACECGFLCAEGVARCAPCSEPDYVLTFAGPDCEQPVSPDWMFTLAPRSETSAVGTDWNTGVLLAERPSVVVTIRDLTGRDPFHNPERLVIGSPSLFVERCELDGTCDAPESGWFVFETGGAGELWVSLQLNFRGGSVEFERAWYSWGSSCP